MSAWEVSGNPGAAQTGGATSVGAGRLSQPSTGGLELAIDTTLTQSVASVQDPNGYQHLTGVSKPKRSPHWCCNLSGLWHAKPVKGRGTGAGCCDW